MKGVASGKQSTHEHYATAFRGHSTKYKCLEIFALYGISHYTKQTNYLFYNTLERSKTFREALASASLNTRHIIVIVHYIRIYGSKPPKIRTTSY